MSELGETLSLETNTLTPRLKRLESQGRVQRVRDVRDERQVRLQLTDAGRALRQEAGRSVVENGNGAGAPACGVCHGVKLEGNPAIHAPALAGLPASRILERLAHYAGPDGHSALMHPVAAALTPREREALAAYISRLPKPSAAP